MVIGEIIFLTLLISSSVALLALRAFNLRKKIYFAPAVGIIIGATSNNGL